MNFVVLSQTLRALGLRSRVRRTPTSQSNTNQQGDREMYKRTTKVGGKRGAPGEIGSRDGLPLVVGDVRSRQFGFDGRLLGLRGNRDTRLLLEVERVAKGNSLGFLHGWSKKDE